MHHDVEIGRQLRDIGQVAFDDLDPAVEQLGSRLRRLPEASAKIGFLTTEIIRSRALADPFRRTSTAGLVSGSSVKIFHSSCSPMNPVTPVITIFLPASRSFSRPSSSCTEPGRWLLCLGGRNDHAPARGAGVPALCGATQLRGRRGPPR